MCVCVPQGGVCVCQDGVCARTAGRATAAVVPSPRRPAGQLTARCAAGGADVCVADVCVTTLGATETSARDALPARAPANHTGTVSFCVPPQSMMGALPEQLGAESLSLSVGLSGGVWTATCLTVSREEKEDTATTPAPHWWATRRMYQVRPVSQ